MSAPETRILANAPPTIQQAVFRAREVAAGVLVPAAERVDRDAAWPEAGLRALQSSGLGGLVAPCDTGGSGLGLLALGRVCEALAEACASTAMCYGMHAAATAVIAARATADQKRRYLIPIACGEHLTTLALSERGTGAHFYLPQCRLVPTPDGFQISGTKTFVTNGRHADSYVVSTAPLNPEREPGRFSCLLVRKEAAGIAWGEPWAGWGLRGNSSVELTLDGVVVPDRDRLGAEGDHIWYVFNVAVVYILTAMAGTYLGLTASALEEGRRHLLARRHSHSGGALANNPVLQHRFGQLWAQVERTRSLLYRAAEMGDRAHPDALPAMFSAKAEVAECADRVVAEVMTLLGGLAYRDGAKAQRLYRDARAAHVMAPTTDVLRAWTGRAVLGLPILGE